ncbi:ubiquinol--cytochrome-c reductase subunit 9 [Lachancea thermotolerans CBS 6340]|uniref:Complex III subunit 9 n=1 Tax=Lachancea thermotolerans (strain ATCC 56472 / CBS 6340 / NRRL Y-8284) TaxID=559295 RepID=C5DCK0_LACTC|nr:KLTH0B03674p [Lachancea thermotolerans CBS 6340]CAR21511.1 KLTH0B03674p [Lachancea thermotolerans CBS 6340]
MAFSTIYNIFFKRNSIFVGTVFASSFVFQAAFDSAVTSWYEQHNKGKLWKDVKAKLAQGGDDDDEDDEDDE